MATARLVVILALASLLATQAAETRPSFVEWIKQGSGKVQSAYEEVEVESACLQTTGVDHCRCHREVTFEGQDHPTCLEEYTEVKLDCCESSDKEQYSHTVEELVAEKHSVGSCAITQKFFDKPITYKNTDAIKIGDFWGTCELTEKAGHCGSPLCEGMSLVVSGAILRYSKVAFIQSVITNKNIGEDCRDPKFFPVVYPPPAKTTPAKIQYSKGGDADDTTFQVGQGDIYAGNFHVVSRYHKTPYKSGKYQLVTSTGAVYQTVKGSPPDKCYVAKDGAAALDFIKSGGNY